MSVVDVTEADCPLTLTDMSPEVCAIVERVRAAAKKALDATTELEAASSDAKRCKPTDSHDEEALQFLGSVGGVDLVRAAELADKLIGMMGITFGVETDTKQPSPSSNSD